MSHESAGSSTRPFRSHRVDGGSNDDDDNDDGDDDDNDSVCRLVMCACLEKPVRANSPNEGFGENGEKFSAPANRRKFSGLPTSAARSSNGSGSGSGSGPSS